MRSARLFSLAFVISLSLLSPFFPKAAHAQGIVTGGISGVVADPTGAVIPGASVTATNASTNSTAKTVSGKGGEFSFVNLPVGTYTLSILASGFSGATVQNVLVTSGRDQAIGIQKLTTSGKEEVVQVSAAANILETSQAQITTTFDAEQLTNLPVGSSGGFDELALLIPGVVNTHSDNFSNTNGAGISSNGQRGRANNFELDGQSNNDNSVAGPQVFFSNDEALQEVQIITNNFSAEYGRNMGSVVNYITKSGTNTWHGSAVYKYSGNFTSSRQTGESKGPQFGFCAAGQTPDADGCLPNIIPRYVSNWWGGTLGGAILKNKLFAFGSTYFQHFTEFGALTTSGVSQYPTTAGLTQLAGLAPDSNGVTILQQVSPYAVTVGNPRQTGPTTFQTVTINGTGYQVPFAQYGRQIPTLDSDQEDLGRIDWNATPKDHLYVRYFYQKEPDFPGDSVASGGFYDVSDVVQSVGADETHIFGPHWVDQLRYSFQQSTLAFNAGGFPNCNITNFTDCPSQITINNSSASGGVAIGGLGLASNLPQGRIVKAGQLQNNATWNIGEHAITFGGEFDYTNSPNTFLPNASGTFNYDTLDDFIAGGCPAGSTACNLTLAVGNPVSPFKENDFALYIQDDWKISSSFTANLGFRYEFFQQAINLLHRESVANQTGPNPPWDTELPLSQTTIAAVPDYYKNFEPRLGFAFNPAFQRRLVIRGGYAINVDPAFYNINLNVATSAPLVNLGTVYCTPGVACLPTGGATFATVQEQDAHLIPTGGNPGLDDQSNVAHNFRNPMSQTYTLGVQYQINNHNVAEVRYTGNHTARQFQSLNSNPYLAQVAAAFPNVVNPASLCSPSASQLDGADVGFLNCGHTSVDTVANTAWSLYNSLQMSLTTRNYHGVSGTFAFTHAQTTDNASEIYSTGGQGNTIAYAQNPLNTDFGERGSSAINFPNVASISFVYQFPRVHGGKLVDRLVNGWQANAIWFYNSGQPYTDYEFTTSASGQVNPNDPRSYTSYSDPYFNGAFVGADVARPIVSNPKAPVGTLGIYTDTGDGIETPFSSPFLVDYASGAPVSPSQVHFIANNQLAANLLNNPYPGGGRNILRGNTTNNLDFSVFKTTRITERVSFQLRVNAFNILNRSQYNNPGAALNDYNFAYFNNFLYSGAASGSNVGTGTGVRNMTFEGRILF